MAFFPRIWYSGACFQNRSYAPGRRPGVCPIKENLTEVKTMQLIINPNAGTRQGRRFLPEILSAFSQAGYLCNVCVTDARGTATDFAAAHGGNADLVVACGGDGTLNEVITGLLRAGHQTPIGYIPCGSTNDFAAGLGLPLQVPDACESILCGEPQPLDVGLFAGDRYFSYTASFGLFTSVSWSTPQNTKNLLGHTAYLLEGIRSLADIHPVHMKITAGDQVYERDWLFGAVCNSTSLGGVLRLDESEVHMSDGLFEALLIPFPPDLLAVNRIWTDLTQKNYDSDEFTFIRASAFTFEGSPHLPWTLDGEEADAEDPLTVRNLRQAIHLVHAR